MREYQNRVSHGIEAERVPLYQKMREYQNAFNGVAILNEVPLYQKMREYQNHCVTRSIYDVGSFIPKDERVPKYDRTAPS